MNEVKKGDVVVLKSGGPKMTVNSLEGEGKIHCIWFSDSRVKCSDIFDIELLRVIDQNEATSTFS